MESGLSGRKGWRGIVLFGRSIRGVYRECKMNLGFEGRLREMRDFHEARIRLLGEIHGIIAG